MFFFKPYPTSCTVYKNSALPNKSVNPLLRMEKIRDVGVSQELLLPSPKLVTPNNYCGFVKHAG